MPPVGAACPLVPVTVPVLGRIYARPEDQETLRRSIYQSLQQMAFRGGALDPSVTNVTEENFMLWPNLDQIPVINAAYEKMIAEETNNPRGLQQNMETAHKNFLKQAIYSALRGWPEQTPQLLVQLFEKASIPTPLFRAGKGRRAWRIMPSARLPRTIRRRTGTKPPTTSLAIFNREFVCLIQRQ